MTIRNFKKEDLPSLDYELDAEQDQFTRGARFCVEERRDDADSHKTLVTIVHENQPVGFFVLDVGNDKFNYTKNDKAILIRSLSLNPKFQGKGIAKRAMLDTSEFARKFIKGHDELVLAVNFKNKNAYNLYLKCGFDDSGEVAEGRNGPQHILSKKI